MIETKISLYEQTLEGYGQNHLCYEQFLRYMNKSLTQAKKCAKKR